MGKPVSHDLDEDVIAACQTTGARQEVSPSGHVNDTLRAAESNAWPPGFFDLFGSVEDSTFTRPDQLPISADAPGSRHEATVLAARGVRVTHNLRESSRVPRLALRDWQEPPSNVAPSAGG
jgi:hypothetical protein